jgi:hypothetical protein
MSFIVTTIKLVFNDKKPKHTARPEGYKPPDELLNGIDETPNRFKPLVDTVSNSFVLSPPTI